MPEKNPPKNPPKKKYKDIDKYLSDFSSAASTTFTNKSPILSSAKIKQDVKKLENDEAAKKLLKSNPALGFKGKVPESDKVDYRYTNSQSKSYSGNPNMAFAAPNLKGKARADAENYHNSIIGGELLGAGIGSGISKSLNKVKSLKNISKPIEPIAEEVVTQPVKKSWKIQDLPGLHLQSTMEGGAINRIVEPKTGLVNIEQALGIIGKEAGGADKVALIKKGLGETIPKKIDFNDFRKITQEQLIPLERQFVDYASDYGINRLGYKKPEFITRNVNGKTINELTSDVIENQTLVLSNKGKFGRGSSAHGNPEETLGHIHFLRDAETPDALTATQIQSDAFQGTHRIMPKNAPDVSKVEKSLQRMQELQERNKSVLNKMKTEGVDEAGLPVQQYQIKQFEDIVQAQEAANLMKKGEVENFTQKSLLDKNHQERYLQELVDYAGKRGDVSKIRVPTSETAAKVQGYNKIPTERPQNFEGYWDVNTSGNYSPEHQTILKKYSEQPKTIKKLFGEEPKTVFDSKGNDWYEFDIPKKFKEGKGEIKAFTTTAAVVGGTGAIQQAQGSNLKQYATGGLINNNNNNMINKYKGDSHFDPSGGIGLSTAIVEDGELEYKGYIFSKDSEEKKKLEKEQALRAIRTNKDDDYVSDKISRDSLNRAAIPLVVSHEANRINKLMADLDMAEQGLAEAGIAPQEDMMGDPSQMDQLPIMAAGGLAPRITTNQQYDNNLGLDSPTLDTSGFNNRFASSSNFRPDARFSPEFNQPSVSTLAKPSLSSALNTQPSSTESVEPSSNTTLANPNVENKKLGFEAVKSANNSTLNSSFNPSFTPTSTDPSLINPQRYKDISVMPKSSASSNNPVNITPNANTSMGKAANAIGYANAGINLGSTLYDTFKAPQEEVNQDVSQDAGYIADMEGIAQKRKDLATGTTIAGTVGGVASTLGPIGAIVGGVVSGVSALSQAVGTAALDEEEKTAKKDNTAKVKKRLFIDNRDYGGTEMVSTAPRNRQALGYGGFKENKQIMACGGKKRMAEGGFNDVPKIKNYSTRENNPDYTAVPPNDLMGPPMQPQWMNDLSSRPSYSVSGTATGPNTPMSTIGSSGNLPEDKKKVDWGNIAETAGMGLLSNAGNLAYLFDEGKDYDKVNYGSYTPEMVNTSSSRRAIRDSIATAREGLKESNKLDRASMAMLATQGAKQYADAEERIRLANTGMFNDAQLKNIDINMRQQNDEAMNKGQALTNYYNALNALGQNTQAAGRGYNLRTSDAEKQRLVNENNARLKEWIASLT